MENVFEIHYKSAEENLKILYYSCGSGGGTHGVRHTGRYGHRDMDTVLVIVLQVLVLMEQITNLWVVKTVRNVFTGPAWILPRDFIELLLVGYEFVLTSDDVRFLSVSLLR